MSKKHKKNRKQRRRSDMVYGRREARTLEQLHVRSALLSPDSVNEESRTVTATLTTEASVIMYDWREDKYFEEVLLTEGGSWRENTVIYNNHQSWAGALAVYGSVNNRQIVDNEWQGEMCFVRDDEDVDKVWSRVRDGHVRGVSAGYMYHRKDVRVIPQGDSVEINGRTYAADNNLEKRVVMKWRGHEVSVAPVQADEGSHTRSQDGNGSEGKRPACLEAVDFVPEHEPPAPSPSEPSKKSSEIGTRQKPAVESATIADANSGGSTNSTSRKKRPMGYLAFLRSLGLSETASEASAAMFHGLLDGNNRTTADELYRAENDKDFETPAVELPEAPEGGDRSSTPTETPEEIAARVRREELERVDNIRAFGVGLDENLVNTAIEENWDLERARSTFLPLQRARSAPAQTTDNVGEMTRNGQAPGMSTYGGPSLQTLQAALMLNRNAELELDDARFRSRQAQAMFARDFTQAEWFLRWNRNPDTASDESKRAADEAHHYSDMQLVDFCRYCCEMEGIASSGHGGGAIRDMVTRALGTASAVALFSTNFQAELLRGFMSVEDTTQGWLKEIEVQNWQPVEQTQKGKISRLRRSARGTAPPQATFSAGKEQLRVHTYDSKWEMTREDILDDRLGGLGDEPDEMGEAARELRPELAYATLLANPAMADGNNFFMAGVNLHTGMGFDIASLDTAKTKFRTHRDNGRSVSEKPNIWVVPESKEWTADRLMGSEEDRDPSATSPTGTKNPAKGKFRVVAEPRLDSGFVNPFDDTEVAPSPNTHFMTSQGARHGLAVAYLKADNKAPITESYRLADGRIGMGFAINMVIGVGPIGRLSIARLQA